MAFLDDIGGGFSRNPIGNTITGGFIGGGLLGGLKERQRRKDANDPNAAIRFFQENAPQFQSGGAGVSALSGEALRTGPSAFGRLAEQQAFTEEAEARGNLAEQAGAEGAAASTRLASRGGLTSGARERVAKESSRAGILAGQEAGRQGTFARLKGRLADEANRQGAIQNLAQADITTQGQRNVFEQEKFNKFAELFGAQQQANIIEKQGSPGLLGGGGFLGLGIGGGGGGGKKLLGIF